MESKLRRKIIVKGDNFSFAFVEKFEETSEQLMINPLNPVGSDSICSYYSPGIFTEFEITELKGMHFIGDFFG